ncbi:hypothetical protein ACEQ8H_005004 [Pleosporales sp. CAS-2024a]
MEKPRRAKWTDDDKMLLLACIDECVDHGYKFELSLPRMLQSQGHDRSWNSICAILLKLVPRGGIGSFRESGSQASDQAGEWAAGIEAFRPIASKALRAVSQPHPGKSAPHATTTAKHPPAKTPAIAPSPVSVQSSPHSSNPKQTSSSDPSNESDLNSIDLEEADGHKANPRYTRSKRAASNELESAPAKKFQKASKVERGHGEDLPMTDASSHASPHKAGQGEQDRSATMQTLTHAASSVPNRKLQGVRGARTRTVKLKINIPSRDGRYKDQGVQHSGEDKEEERVDISPRVGFSPSHTQTNLAASQTPTNSELRKRSNELDDREAPISHFEGVISDLKTKLRTTQVENIALRKETNSAQQEMLQLQTTVDDLHQSRDRIKDSLDRLQKPSLLKRYDCYRLPFRYERSELAMKWTEKLRSLETILGEAEFSLDSPPGPLHALLCEVTGKLVSANTQSSVADFGVLEVDGMSRSSILIACFMARVIRWCFETNFHISGVDSDKLHEVWVSLAKFGGLQLVRQHDLLATMQIIKNGQLRKHEIPGLARTQMRVFVNEFLPYFPSLKKEQTLGYLFAWLEEIMHWKIELLVAQDLHKIVFIPPGTPYDPDYMIGEDEDRAVIDSRHKDKYQVRICWSPALIGNISDSEWPNDSDIHNNPYKYTDALLDSRNFFPEEAGKWRGWPDCKPIGKAMVLVEEIAALSGSGDSRSSNTVQDSDDDVVILDPGTPDRKVQAESVYLEQDADQFGSK